MSRRNLRQGFTLIELLVSIAIIGILASLILPTMIRARRSAMLSEDISRLRQFGVAAAIYSDTNNGVLVGRMQPLLDQKLFNHTLTHSNLDPTPQGWVNAHLEYYSGHNPKLRNLMYTKPQSYFGIHDLFPKRDLEEFRNLPGDPGWLVAVSPNPELSIKRPSFMLNGPMFRLTFSGAVLRKQPEKSNVVEYIAAFRDKKPSLESDLD